MKTIFEAFGLQFEEREINENEEDTNCIYDYDKNISYVIDENDNKIPFIKWSKIFLGTKTGDQTKQMLDTPDSD